MMKLSVPKKQKDFSVSKIYYVTSESKPDETHIVVRLGGSIIRSFFCDCRDFMIRKLPNLGTGRTPLGLGLCKHGEFVRDTEDSIPAGYEVVSAVRGDVKYR
jgi:hypothetical protein